MSFLVLRDVASVSFVDPAGSGEASWNPSEKSLALTYQNQANQPVTTSVPRGEDKVLGQNVFGGAPVTIASQTVLGAIYLPACVLSATSSAYLNITGNQQAVDLSVVLQIPGQQPTVVAEFVLNGNAQVPVTASVNPTIFQATIPAGWYEINVGMTSQNASGYVYGIRIVAEPLP